MRIFKTKWFHKWAAKEGLSDSALTAAVDEMEEGLVDADLGGHVFKKRASIEGQGKSGGLRTLLAFKVKDKAFFMFGFAKSKRANIDDKALKALKLMAANLLGYDGKALKKAIKAKELIEIERVAEEDNNV